jgi:hypothetical protein
MLEAAARGKHHSENSRMGMPVHGNYLCASGKVQMLQHFQSTGLSTARKSACASLVTPLLISFSGKLE